MVLEGLIPRLPGPRKSWYGRFVPLNDVWRFRPADAIKCVERLQTAASNSSLGLCRQPGLYLDLTDHRLRRLMDGTETLKWGGFFGCCLSKERCDKCKDDVGKMEAALWDVAVLETAIWVPDENIRRKSVAGREGCSDIGKLRGGLLQLLLDFLPEEQRQLLASPTKLNVGRYRLLKDAWKGQPATSAEGEEQLLNAAATVPVGLVPAAPGVYVNFMHPKIVKMSTYEDAVGLGEFDQAIIASLVWVPDKFLYLEWAWKKKRGLIGRLSEDVFQQLVAFLPRPPLIKQMKCSESDVGSEWKNPNSFPTDGSRWPDLKS